ncbi:hypothetical protein A0H81_01255 [Grifola frondosa]|uniref:Uncharacterized protein n=1 Tax=Grifola frondosa TaxID=5627 RepID=A0A1C7MPH0_GRIFR|nr:hypothetical protein A0H81_01255 [Grifola frondosa]
MIQETTANPPVPTTQATRGRGFRSGSTQLLMRSRTRTYFVSPYVFSFTYSTIGSCYMDKRRKLVVKGLAAQMLRARRRIFRLAASHYTRAAQKYPEDDEMHPYFLMIAFQARWHRGEPLRQTTSLCVRIRTALEKAEKIWRHSPFWGERHALTCYAGYALVGHSDSGRTLKHLMLWFERRVIISMTSLTIKMS